MITKRIVIFYICILILMGSLPSSGFYQIETTLLLDFQVVDEPYEYDPTRVLFSPDRIGVTGHYTRSISFYDNNGTYLFHRDDYHSNVMNVQLVLPNEDTYITRDLDGKIAFWDASEDLNISDRFSLPDGYNYWNSESPMAISDNYCLAFHSNQAPNRTLHVYDLLSNEYIYNYTTTYYDMKKIAISPDCTELAYVQRNYPFGAEEGERFNTFKILDIVNNETIFTREYERDETLILSLTYTHSGSLIALLNYVKDNSNISDLAKYDTSSTGADRFNIIKTYRGTANFFLHPTYDLLAINDYSDKAQFYFEENDKAYEVSLDVEANMAGFSTDGQKLMVTTGDSVYIYNFNFWNPTTISQETTSEGSEISSNQDSTSTSDTSPFNLSFIIGFPIIMIIKRKKIISK